MSNETKRPEGQDQPAQQGQKEQAFAPAPNTQKTGNETGQEEAREQNANTATEQPETKPETDQVN